MNSGLIYYYKITFKNRLKNIIRKPFKSIGSILLSMIWLYYPFIFKRTIVDMGLDNPSGYITIFAVIIIFFSLPIKLSYFKRKGIVFNESDINLLFTSPISPKDIIVHGMTKNIVQNVFKYIVLFIAALYIFKISIIKSLLICLGGIILTNTIDISMGIIMYGSEKISIKTKEKIQYLVYTVLIILAIFILLILAMQGFTMENFKNILTGNLMIMVPILVWEIGFLRLILFGGDIFSTISAILYIASTVGLLIVVRRMKIVGEYYEEALSFSEDYTKAIKESKKDGGIKIVGKKNEYKDIEFSTKGRFAKAIFYKQLDELKKVSFLSKYGRMIIYFLSSMIFGTIFKIIDPSTSPYIVFAGCYILSSYTLVFFSSKKTWKKEFEIHYTYLIPDTVLNKIIYSTAVGHIKNLVEGIALFTPVSLMLGFPIYYGILCGIIYMGVGSVLLYFDLMISEILGARIGAMVTSIIMITLDIIILGLGLLLAFTVSLFFLNIWMIYGILLIYLGLISTLGIFISTKLYNNMEFVTEE